MFSLRSYLSTTIHSHRPQRNGPRHRRPRARRLLPRLPLFRPVCAAGWREKWGSFPACSKLAGREPKALRFRPEGSRVACSVRRSACSDVLQ